MNDIGNSTGGTDWAVFPHQTQDAQPVIVHSRIGEPSVREFAEANFIARVRCVLPRGQVNENGMPLSTQSMDEWEDKVLTELGPDARTYLVAVVTGAGVRDLFFTAAEDTELLAAISNVDGDFTFELQLARVDGPREGLLNSLTPPQ